MTDTLKPCPFCGGPASIRGDLGLQVLGCADPTGECAGANIGLPCYRPERRAESIKRWNRRAAAPTPPAQASGQDDEMVSLGGTAPPVPRWLLDAVQRIGQYMDAHSPGDWAIGGIQKRQASGQAAPSDETLRLAGVIADKIEDGTLFQAGIFSRRDLADKIRAVVRFARQGVPLYVDPVPNQQTEQQPVAPEDYKIPCDVMLPPATRIKRGCSLNTLMVAIAQRESLPPAQRVFAAAMVAQKADDARDAARYRWLRDGASMITDLNPWEDVGFVCAVFVCTEYGSQTALTGEDLDAAIDAAMQRTSGGAA